MAGGQFSTSWFSPEMHSSDIPGSKELVILWPYTAEYQSPAGWRATMVVECPAGLPVCRSLTVTAPEGVRTRVLRQITLDTILRRSAAMHTFRKHDQAVDTTDPRFEAGMIHREFSKLAARPVPHGRTRFTPDFLRGVARAYQRAPHHGRCDAVAEYGRQKLQVSVVADSTAYHWIAEAKDAGYLPRARRRR